MIIMFGFLTSRKMTETKKDIRVFKTKARGDITPTLGIILKIFTFSTFLTPLFLKDL
jgi:hypothetical protein